MRARVFIGSESPVTLCEVALFPPILYLFFFFLTFSVLVELNSGSPVPLFLVLFL